MLKWHNKQCRFLIYIIVKITHIPDISYQKAFGKYLSHSISHMSSLTLFSKRNTSRKKGGKKASKLIDLPSAGLILHFLLPLGLYICECYELASLTFVANG